MTVTRAFSETTAAGDVRGKVTLGQEVRRESVSQFARDQDL